MRYLALHVVSNDDLIYFDTMFFALALAIQDPGKAYMCQSQLRSMDTFVQTMSGRHKLQGRVGIRLQHRWVTFQKVNRDTQIDYRCLICSGSLHIYTLHC